MLDAFAAGTLLKYRHDFCLINNKHLYAVLPRKVRRHRCQIS